MIRQLIYDQLIVISDNLPQLGMLPDSIPQSPLDPNIAEYFSQHHYLNPSRL